MRKFATKIVSRQNSVNQYFGMQIHIFYFIYFKSAQEKKGNLFGILGVLFGVLGVLFGVLCVLFGVLGIFVWHTLYIVGVHYIFLA